MKMTFIMSEEEFENHSKINMPCSYCDPSNEKQKEMDLYEQLALHKPVIITRSQKFMCYKCYTKFKAGTLKVEDKK